MPISQVKKSSPLAPTTDALGINNLAEAPALLNEPLKKVFPKIVRSCDATIYEIPGEKGSLSLDSEATGNRLVAGTMEIAPHAGPPPHIHTLEDEIFIIQSGEIKFFLNGEYVLANAGDVVFAARNEVHGFCGMTHSEPNIMIGLIAPAGFEKFFAGRAALMTSPNTTPKDLIEQAFSFGITIFQPDAILPIVESPKSKVVRAGTGLTLKAFGDRVEVLLSSSQTDGQYTLTAIQTPPLNGPPLHIHENEDELFWIQESSYEFIIETGEKSPGEPHKTEKVVAYPGDVVWAPRQLMHTFRNIGDQKGLMYVAAIPGNFDAFFAANSDAFKNEIATPEKLLAIGAEFGIRYVI